MPVCTYCQREFPKLTVDHVFARSFYPSSTPANVEKWTVPACRDCNNKYSRLEEAFLLRVSMCVNPMSPAAEGIWPRRRRSISPNSAKGQRDRRAREAKQRELIRDLQDFPTRPEVGVLPAFDKNWDQGSRTAVLISADDSDALTKKWVQGTHYKTLRRLISDTSEIKVFQYSHESAEDPIMQGVMEKSKTYRLGPGIEVKQAIGADISTTHTLYRFKLWAGYLVYASLREDLCLY